MPVQLRSKSHVDHEQRSQSAGGAPADTFEDRGFTFHSIGDKYLRAVAEVARCIPIMIPALDADFDLEGLLDRLDGG